jgi:hypothetical protein
MDSKPRQHSGKRKGGPTGRESLKISQNTYKLPLEMKELDLLIDNSSTAMEPFPQ